jgi:penicillin-binding protein 1A
MKIYHNLPDEPKTAKKKSGGNRKGKITKTQGAKYVASVIGTTFLTFFLIIVITVCVVAVALTVYITQFADSMYDVDIKDFELSYSSFVLAYDKDKDDYVEILQLSADENRIWVDLEDVPQHTLDALVATEDRRFYEHAGVDWTRTIFAAMNEFLGGGEDTRQQGGSTLTQQLVRDITKDNDVNMGRKLREIFRAMSLEQKHSKHDIIESYLNRVAFGNTVYGIGSAARHYFDKEANELTIAESCILVGLLPSPVAGNPYTNPQWNRQYQKQAIFNLYNQGFITYAQYEEALDEKVKFRLPVSGEHWGYVDERWEEWHGLQNEDNDDEDDDLYYQNVDLSELVSDPFRWNEYHVTHNWYVDAALKQIAHDLVELKDISYEAAIEQVRTGGFKIHLAMDVEMQEKIEEVYNNEYLARNPGAPYPAGTPARDTIQSAFVIMDMFGNVVALAGGLGDKPGNDVFNRATQATRNIGSTIKPFGVYAPGIDMDKITYSTMLLDASGRIDDPDNPGQFKKWPQNYERNFGLNGLQTPWFALMKSTNTVSARTLHMVTPQVAFDFLQNRLGITSLTSRHLDYSPLATGAMELKLHEVAGAYQVFGTGGVYYKPAFYSRVEDHTGKIVLEKDVAGIQAIGADSAWIVNRMMLTVVNDPGGTGKFAKENMDGIDVVGKTGTANDLSDILFAGLTPDYVGIVRIGFDDNRALSPSPGGDGWIPPARIWSNVMSKVIPKNPSVFVPEESVVATPYCASSGLIAGSGCPNGAVGYYKPSNTPQTCPHDGSEWSLTPPIAREHEPLYRA